VTTIIVSSSSSSTSCHVHAEILANVALSS
jgi:hypothetical protein